MSIIWTHIQFSEDVVDSIRKTDDFAQFERYMKLGTQLTNLVYYFNSCSKKKRENDNIIFNQTDLSSLLLNIIEKSKEKPKHIQAFVFGVITHYVLETNIRPYLNHLNKTINCNDINEEAQIDTLIMKKTYNLKTWKTPVYNEINVGLFIDKNIVQLLTEVKHPLAQHIQKAYCNLKWSLKLYFDPYGWKAKLLPSFQPIYSPYFHSQNGIDYLNIRKKKWYNHTTKSSSHYNFLQLYDIAKLQATALLDEVTNYWDSTNGKLSSETKELLNLTHNSLPFTRTS